MIDRLLESTSFTNGLMTIIDMLILLGITQILFRVNGLGSNGIKRAYSNIGKVRRCLLSFRKGFDNKSLTKINAHRLLNTMRVRLHDTGSIIRVYEFEGYKLPEISAAVKKFADAEKKCDDVAVYYNECRRDEFFASIEEMESEMKESEELVNKIEKKIRAEKEKKI